MTHGAPLISPWRPWRLGVLAFLFATCAPAHVKAPEDAEYLLHLPGIAGYRWIDQQMIAGLKEGGYEGRVAVHDWPGEQAGLGALFNRERNENEAKRVAEALEKRYRENPSRRIVLTAHSGGTGILVWALEKLPDDVRVDTVILLASALSPQYDLSQALRHVRGRMFSFHSDADAVVLGTGTRAFGTMDGVKCDAAGRCGFVSPDGADKAEYEKLVQVPYDTAWMRLGHIGDHVGPLGRRFSREVLAPLVLGKSEISNLKSEISNGAPPQEPAVGQQAEQRDAGAKQRRARDAAGK